MFVSSYHHQYAGSREDPQSQQPRQGRIAWRPEGIGKKITTQIRQILVMWKITMLIRYLSIHQQHGPEYR